MSDMTQVAEVPAIEERATMTQRKKNEAAVRLLEDWLKDESGYDEKTWPNLKAAIEANRLSYRSRFRG